MLWYWIEVAQSLLDEVNILLVVLNTTGNNKALSWSDVVHDELLKKSSIDVVNVLFQSKSWHTEGVESVCSSEKELLVQGEWVELGEMLEEIVRFMVLIPSNVSGEDRSWLKGNVDHHLEHINDIVLNAVSLEESSLLIEIHGHSTTRHLNHTVVNGLVSVFKCLEISILKGQK